MAILLIAAAAGCTRSSSAPPAPGPSSPAGAAPAAAQSGAAPGWRAPVNLNYNREVEDPTSVSCPSATFCMAVLGSGYAASYDGTTWSKPASLPSANGQPGSVSCSSASFCITVDAQDSSAFRFNGSTWSPAPAISDPGSGGLP